MDPVRAGLIAFSPSDRPPTMVAFRLPMAPSKVFVDLAASTATGLEPSSSRALLNSAAVISPFAIASRKLPVNAPFFFNAAWIGPDAPGIASAN